MKSGIGIVILLCSSVFSEDYWRSLFNGKDFTGWIPEGPGPLNGSAWEIRDSAIYGENVASQPVHGICWSEDEYGDFTIRLKYKDIRDNSGFYFRSVRDPGILSIAGMQVEIDPTRDAGSFYETNGRNWVERVTQAFHDSVHRVNDWNNLIVEAYGTHITSYVNGRLGVDLPNDRQGRLRGYFGLQTHGSLNTQVYFKDIEILDSSYCETDAPCEASGRVCDVREGSPTENSCIEPPPCTGDSVCTPPQVCDLEAGSPTYGQCIDPVAVQWGPLNGSNPGNNKMYRIFKVNGAEAGCMAGKSLHGFALSAGRLGAGIYIVPGASPLRPAKRGYAR